LEAHKRIIVVDDEEPVRTYVSQILRDQPYTLMLASSGEEALALARQHKDETVLVITDIVMPHMDGLELGEILEDEMPQLPTLYITGYDLPDLHLLPNILTKPFTPPELLAKVQESLLLGEEPVDEPAN
jgi:CheY-like chemotaxis protein